MLDNHGTRKIRGRALGTKHDDVNLLCMEVRIIGPKVAEEIFAAYLRAKFSTDEDYVLRLSEMEKR
jgi:ribose 5-phosphate isomerase RpiB